MTTQDEDQTDWDDVPGSVTEGDDLDWDALAASAVRRDRLIALLEKLGEYTPDNSQPAEYANVQARIKAIKEQILNLTPTAVSPLPQLPDILASVIAELHRFLVLRLCDAQIVALWIVHAHVFLHQFEDKSCALHNIFDHTPRLIVWSQTHGSGKSNMAEIIGKLAPNVESVSSLTGGELKAFMYHEAENRNNLAIQKFYKDNDLLGLVPSI